MRLKQYIHALLCILSALMLGMGACSQSASEQPIPKYTNTKAIYIILYDGDGPRTTIVSKCNITNGSDIRDILDCLTPCEHTELADSLVKGLPIIGRLELLGMHGSTIVEFVRTGKNSLHFRAGGKGYRKGGKSYEHYRSDHKRLYGIDSPAIDESDAFYSKLESICASSRIGQSDMKRGDAASFQDFYLFLFPLPASPTAFQRSQGVRLRGQGVRL